MYPSCERTLWDSAMAVASALAMSSLVSSSCRLRPLAGAGLFPGRLVEAKFFSIHPVERRRRSRRPARALFGGEGGGSGKEDKKKFISKEEEPEQYWQTADEKAGKGPMSSPLPYIAILGLLFPFIILGIAFANDWIKIPVR